MKIAWLVGLLACWIVGAAAAAEVALEGELTQGGLVIGRTAPGASVALDGQPVRVGPDGVFLLGFGRDAKAEASLTVGATTKVLTIAPRDYDIQRIDGLPERKVTPDPEDLARIKADNAKIGAVRRLDSDLAGFLGGFERPADGPVSGIFGSQRILNGQPKSPHNGMDIAAPEGAPVRAMAAGRVALVHPDMFYSGKTVMIDHGHGLSSVYIHMSEIAVQDGQMVEKGQPIGAVGQTGRATGPHLHWGVSLFGTHLDPGLLLAD